MSFPWGFKVGDIVKCQYANSSHYKEYLQITSINLYNQNIHCIDSKGIQSMWGEKDSLLKLTKQKQQEVQMEWL